MKRAFVLCSISLFGGTLLYTAPAHAQAEDWQAWHGCWQAEGAPGGETLCIVPDGAAGVRLLTVAGGAVVAESRVITDGRARPVQTDGCDGSEVATWSADYQRVFLNSELSCEGGVKRQASGVFTITSIASWMSVQAVTIDGRTATRVVRSTAVDDAVAPATVRSALRRSVLDRTTARSTALLPIDADDVNEAVERIDAAAVQEWLIATGQPFQLADELAPIATDVSARSALDHVGYYAQDRQPTREIVHVVERPVEVVHIIERPVYVTHTHVHEYRYRNCWDPFFAGVVVGVARGVSIGLGQTHCGRSYFSHHSPWGYGLHGWRFVHVKPVVVRGRAVIHHREPYRQPRVIYTSRPDRERNDPPRYAQPRTPRSGSTTRAVPSAGTSQPVRTAEPRRGVQPPSRATTTPTPRTQPVIQAPTRSAEPRGSATTRTPTPPPARAATPPRTAQPRTSTSPRPPASGVTSTPRTEKPAATTSRGTLPPRVARPRGGEQTR